MAPAMTVLRLMAAGVAAALLAFAMAASAARAEPAGRLERTAIALVEQFAAGQLSLESALASAGTGAMPQRAGSYWLLAFDGKALVLTLPAEKDQMMREADLALAPEAGLRLQALERSFGSWSPRHREKNASVLFRLRSPQGGEVLAFVRLHTPRPAKDSPVLAIRLRRQPGR